MKNSVHRKFPAIFATLAISSTVLRAQTFPLVVQSIQDLRAVNVTSGAITNGSVVLVVNYWPNSYLGSTHGGGLFRWVIPAGLVNVPNDDGGRFIKPNTNTSPVGGIWQRLLNGGTPNVKMWGAKGDGVTDDYLAISNAIVAIQDDNYWAGELLFPKGTYMVTNTLVFNSDLIHLFGESAANCVVMMRSNYLFDIFRSNNSDNELKGGGSGMDHHLRINDLAIKFQSTQYDTNDAALVITEPGEVNSINNIQTEYGGFGIRCFGTGAPGLRLRDVTCSDASVAGVSLEPIPGHIYDDGNPVSFIGISGDMRSDTASPTASLVRFVNSATGGEISQIKAEGDFGGGVVQYTYAPPSSGFGSYDHGYLEIHNCSYNAGTTLSGSSYPTEFVNLPGTNRTPSLMLYMLTLNCANLIVDNAGDRVISANIAGGVGQMSARNPICYESTGPEWGRLTIGQTVFSYLTTVPNQPNWYRVMHAIPGSHQISGKLIISPMAGRESMEFNIDFNNWTADFFWFNPVRLPYGPNAPTITQIRGVLDAEQNFWVDVNVANVKGPSLTIAFAHDLNEDEIADTSFNQLIPVPYPVNATLPTGCYSYTNNTYR